MIHSIPSKLIGFVRVVNKCSPIINIYPEYECFHHIFCYPLGPVPTSPPSLSPILFLNSRQSDLSNMYTRSHLSSVQNCHCSMFISTSTVLIEASSSLGISPISNMFTTLPLIYSAPFTLSSLLFLKHTTHIPAQEIYTCCVFSLDLCTCQLFRENIPKDPLWNSLLIPLICFSGFSTKCVRFLQCHALSRKHNAEYLLCRQFTFQANLF